MKGSKGWMDGGKGGEKTGREEGGEKVEGRREEARELFTSQSTFFEDAPCKRMTTHVSLCDGRAYKVRFPLCTRLYPYETQRRFRTLTQGCFEVAQGASLV